MFNTISRKASILLITVSALLLIGTAVCVFGDEVPDDYDLTDSYSEILVEETEASEEFYDEPTDEFVDYTLMTEEQEYSDDDEYIDENNSDYEEVTEETSALSDMTDSSSEMDSSVRAEKKQVVDFSINDVLDGFGDSQELYERYTYYLFYPEETDLDNTDDYELTAREEAAFAAAGEADLTTFLFDAMKERIQEVALGNCQYTGFVFQDSDLRAAGFCWSIQDLGLESSDLLKGEEAVYKKLVPVFKSVGSSLAEECPFELYWYNRTKGTNWEYEVELDQDGQICLTSLSVFMPVEPDYIDETIEYALSDDVYYIDQEKVKSAIEAVRKADAIAAQYKGEDDLSKLQAYKERICELADYGTKSNQDDPWPFSAWGEFSYGSAKQLIAVFDGDPETKVDCEGYSKAFQYLCERPENGLSKDTKCFSAKGYRAGIRHMWNIVQMSNGRNYLVDLTPFASTGDTSFFLAGADNKYILDGREYKYRFYKDGFYAEYYYDDDTLSLFDDSVLAISQSDYPSIDLSKGSTVTVPSMTYTGKALKPGPVVKVGSALLQRGTDYTVSYKNNTAVGTGKVIITGAGCYEGTITKSFKVKSLGSIDKASVSGIVKKVYSGKAQTQNPVVKVNGKTLKSNTDYKLSYKTNINAGRAALIITGKGGYTGSQIQYFAILPQTSQITALKAGSKQFKVVWQKKTVQTSGYQLQYSTDKKFQSGSKVLTFYNTGKTSETVKNLKKNKTYYVRLRTFKKANGKTYLSKWSTVKTVKI